MGPNIPYIIYQFGVIAFPNTYIPYQTIDSSFYNNSSHRIAQ